MASVWGDPASESFRRKYIRETRPAGVFALVHEEIVALAARLLEELSTLHVEVPDVVDSYDPSGTAAQRLGLALHLPIALPPDPEIITVCKRWGFEGFQVEGSQLIELRFTGDRDEAKRLDDEARAARLDTLESEDVSGPSPVRWPGLRVLEDGDFGNDVVFLRLLLGAGSEEPVDEGLREAVRRFQARRGAPVTGLIDVDFWRRLLPAGRPHVAVGDSGFVVRVLQAALVAYEGSEHRVSGTWGVLTTRDVTALQNEYNLRRGNYVRAPEWALLLGPVNPEIEEARRAAKGYGVPAPEPETDTPATPDSPAAQTPPATPASEPAAKPAPAPAPKKEPAPAAARKPRQAPAKAKATQPPKKAATTRPRGARGRSAS